MRKSKVLLFLLLMILCIPQIIWAISSNPDNGDMSQSEISNVRFAVHNDMQTGVKKLRLVVDVTGPVQVSAALSSSPAPSLTVNLKGATAGKVANSLTLDGNIASDVSISSIDGASSQLNINLPVAISDSDYKIMTLPGDAVTNKPFRVVIDINKPVIPIMFHFTPGLKKKVIVIDPGHGGSDTGAIGPNNIQEKTVTLAVALKVKDLLEQAGATVYMTRMDDRDVYAPNDSAVDELNARVMVSNQKKADVFLDIHANAFTSPKVGGTATYYYSKTNYDKLLAQSLQNSVIDADGLNDRGISPANFYVLKHTMMPAALIELAFISNPNEENLLNTPQFQQKLAQGLVNGLDSFFTQAAKSGGDN